jgi:hypothetical protein
MGKKDAYSGMAPKDISTLAMDRFIRRNEQKNQYTQTLPARRKDDSIPIHMWPLKDHLQYWENRSDQDRFHEKYMSYSIWHDEVKRISGVYPATFLDYTSKLKTEIRAMYDQCMNPKLAVLELRKHGVY